MKATIKAISHAQPAIPPNRDIAYDFDQLPDDADLQSIGTITGMRSKLKIAAREQSGFGISRTLNVDFMRGTTAPCAPPTEAVGHRASVDAYAYDPPEIEVLGITGASVLKSSQLVQTPLSSASRSSLPSSSDKPTDVVFGKNLRTYAVLNAMSQCSMQDGSLRIRDCKAHMAEYDEAADFVVPCEKIPQRGHGRRPPHGHTFGRSFITKYAQQVADFFHRGELESTDKMQPVCVVEKLEQMYPFRFDQPWERDVQNEFTKLGKKRNQVGQDKAPEDVERAGQCQERGRMQPQYAEEIASIVRNDPTISPREGLEKLKMLFIVDGQMPRGFPVDQKVKNKISAVKQQLRNGVGC